MEETTKEATPTLVHERKFRVPGDLVNRSTAEAPDNVRSAVRWLHAYAVQGDFYLSELGEQLGYDKSVIHKIFNGTYEANMDAVVSKIEALQAKVERKVTGSKIPFIETAMARKIFKVCDSTLEFQRVSFIFGDTQIGKTAALKQYQRDHNHGATVYVSVPTGGNLSLFMAALAKELRFSANSKEKELVRRIKDSFDSRMLLIVDEAHQCVHSSHERSGARVIEFVRSIFDETNCGLVICATNLFREEMERQGGRFAPILRQVRRRRLVALQLPSLPTNDDLLTFARHYGLPPAAGDALALQNNLVADEGLGMWLTLLRMAATYAGKKGQKMEWRHVITAHAGLKSLEGR